MCVMHGFEECRPPWSFLVHQQMLREGPWPSCSVPGELYDGDLGTVPAFMLSAVRKRPTLICLSKQNPENSTYLKETSCHLPSLPRGGLPPLPLIGPVRALPGRARNATN